MTVALDAAAPAASPAPSAAAPMGAGPGTAAPVAAPVQYVVPKVHGDPAAARRLAAAYRVAADEVAAAADLAASVMADVGDTWQGVGHHASTHPAAVVQRNASMTRRALDDAAEALDAYAHKLETAHSHHGFSLHKLLAVAAVVTVTAAAIVVTMGAAAAAEAAFAASAAGEAAAAAGTAVAASEGAAAGLLESTVSLAGVRALISYVVPHLVQAELSAGFAATVEEGTDEQLDWHEIGVASAAGFAGSAGAARAGRIYQSVRFAKKTWPLLHLMMPHVAQGAAWAGADAAEQAGDGSGGISVREMLLAGGAAAAGSALPNVRTAPRLTAKALGPQTLDEMLDGVTLLRHEGDGLGHALAKHVNATTELLVRRVESGVARASRFFDLQTAEAAATAALRDNEAALRKFAAGTTARAQFSTQLPHPIGEVMTEDGVLHEASEVVVVMARNANGVYIKTTYPEIPK